jgi:hypothetical protein
MSVSLWTSKLTLAHCARYCAVHSGLLSRCADSLLPMWPFAVALYLYPRYISRLLYVCRMVWNELERLWRSIMYCRPVRLLSLQQESPFRVAVSHLLDFLHDPERIQRCFEGLCCKISKIVISTCLVVPLSRSRKFSILILCLKLSSEVCKVISLTAVGDGVLVWVQLRVSGW